MKLRAVVWLFVVFTLLTGCSTVKPLSGQERAAIKKICVVSDLNEYFVYCKYRHGTEMVPSRQMSEYVLNSLRTDLIKKGHTLTDNPNEADYRLVIKPAIIRFFEDGSMFDGIAVSSCYSGACAHTAFIMGLVNPETGNCRISKNAYWSEETDVKYAPDSWADYSDREKEILMSALKKAAVPALRTCLKKIGL